MHWCNAVSLHCLSLPHSLNALGLGRMLKSTSGTEPSPLLHTHDTAPIKRKVAPQLTASQGIDYHSMACPMHLGHHWEGHCCRMDHRTSVSTLYIVITTQVPLHIFTTRMHFNHLPSASHIDNKTIYSRQKIDFLYFDLDTE